MCFLFMVAYLRGKILLPRALHFQRVTNLIHDDGYTCRGLGKDIAVAKSGAQTLVQTDIQDFCEEGDLERKVSSP